MDNYLNTIPTRDLINELTDRFSKDNSQGIVYAYQTDNDVALKGRDGGVIVGGAGSWPLRYGLIECARRFLEVDYVNAQDKVD